MLFPYFLVTLLVRLSGAEVSPIVVPKFWPKCYSRLSPDCGRGIEHSRNEPHPLLSDYSRRDKLARAESTSHFVSPPSPEREHITLKSQ
jgi:hypothetical protein